MLHDHGNIGLTKTIYKSADYIATTMNYHTIIISHIPPMSMKIRDKARAIRRPYMLSYLIH
uniref:Uncharacterized protein n=1 Tax=Aegilops tauschii subsp. strangulata TaxID=200361 RepID=A0A453IEJ1_AEGTS